MSKNMSKFDTLAGYRAAAGAWWNERNEQERRMLKIGGAVVAFGIVYGVMIDPAFTGRAKLAKELPQLRQQVAELQAMAGEASQLAGQAQIQPPPMSRDTVNASLQSRGLATQNLTVTGEYAKVEFKGVSFAGLIAWLDTVRREQRINVQDANISAQNTPGQVDATITLRQDSGAR
jgi:general secretion pathway protein M